jgi:hypothetical protein
VLITATRPPAADALVGGHLADPRVDVHVPADRLFLRPAPRQGAVTLAQSVSYFFMLPNACFPLLLPVIDFKTYRRSHYSGDAYLTYQKGVDWIVRGIVHLILYRYFYYHVTLAPSEVTGPASCCSTGCEFHALPARFGPLSPRRRDAASVRIQSAGDAQSLPAGSELHRLLAAHQHLLERLHAEDLLLSSGVRLKRLGTNNAIIIATLYVFLLTWLLHSYQWFWLRGSWLLAWHDMLFWAVLGVLVVVNSLYEIKHGRKRSLGKSKRRAGRATRSRSPRPTPPSGSSASSGHSGPASRSPTGSPCGQR